MAFLEQTERRCFTAEDVECMLAAGILAEDEPVELLNGELVVMSPQNPLHAALTELIARRLESAFGPQVHARRHSPLAVGDDSLPEPDVALVPGPPTAFSDRHPLASEALLVVEIAVTSHAVDREKAALYARAGVPVYWLVDLPGRRLEVRSEPGAEGGYAVTRILGPGDRVEVPGLDRRVEVAELWG